MDEYLSAADKLPLATLRLYAAYHLKFLADRRVQAKRAYARSSEKVKERKRVYYQEKKAQKAAAEQPKEEPKEQPKEQPKEDHRWGGAKIDWGLFWDLCIEAGTGNEATRKGQELQNKGLDKLLSPGL